MEKTTNKPEPTAAIAATQNWVKKMVIGLQLCPFARLPFDEGRIHFRCIEAEGLEAKLVEFWKEIEWMTAKGRREVSNSLLIFPADFQDFGDYLDFLDLAEQLLNDQGRDDDFQLASFHPNYQFDGVGEGDPANSTNRSPYPMLHILRVEEVAAAIAGHPDIEAVPERNVKVLRELGEEGIQKILE